MEITPETKNSPATTQSEIPKAATQSVYFAKPGIMKDYPLNTSDDEIHYDYNVNVMGKTPEEYYSHIEPATTIGKAFKAMQPYFQYGQQAMKLMAVRPDVALGINKLDTNNPVDLHQLSMTYKPWGDILLERGTANQGEANKRHAWIDQSLKDGNYAPWILFESLPGEIMEQGTRPSSFVAMGAAERALGAAFKYGPELINKALENAPEEVRAVFLKDLFKSESGLSKDFETLGISPNSKTVDVKKAYLQKTLDAHPDRGGDADAFISVNKAYSNIMDARKAMFNQWFDIFRGNSSVPKEPLNLSLASESGGAVIPMAEGDLVKVGSDIGKIVAMAEGKAIVNLAGKNQEVAQDKIKSYFPLGNITPEMLSPLGFYSKAERVLNEKVPNVATADQVVKTLLNNGVSQEEISNLGLDSLTGKVTKDDIKATVQANQVPLEEKVLGNETKPVTINDIEYKGIEDYGNGHPIHVIKIPGNVLQLPVSQYPTRTAAIERALQKSTGYDQTKFSQYQLPGGENYREVLIKLPEEGMSGPRIIKYDSIDRVFRAYDNKGNVLGESASQDQLMRNVSEGKGNFRSSHFDDPNILVHARINDRMVDGKKVLFIEEIQSDWHQKGRKEGYQDIGKKSDVTFKSVGQMPGGDYAYDVIDKNGQDIGRVQGANKAEAESKWMRMFEKGVPDAPFKKTWHELMFKRLLDKAVKEGYDSIAWTAGEQQAERYDLSKQIDRLGYKKKGDYYKVSAFKEGRGIPLADGKLIYENDLENWVGKDVAQKIIKGEGEQYNWTANNEKNDIWNELKGVDLKVGGEGMKGFYDQILPSFANKYTKKWGGRVEGSQIGLYNQGKPIPEGAGIQKYEQVHSLSITPEMKAAISKGGQPIVGSSEHPGWVENKPKVEQGKSRFDNRGEADLVPANNPEEELKSMTAAASESAVNLEHIQAKESAKENIKKATEALGSEIENQTGVQMSNDDIVEAAKKAEILKSGGGYDNTLKFAAQILRTKQHLAALAEKGEMSPEFLSTLKALANTGTDLGRLVQSYKIDAFPEYASIQIKIAKELMKLGHSAEEISKAAEGVDFKNLNEVTDFYRKFVKPKFIDELNEFAYLNILSSPKTHIVNAFSNLVQLTGLNPLTRLATGAVDSVGAALTGADRQRYLSEVPEFYKGALNAIPDAISAVKDVMAGKSFVERPDIKSIPTGAKWLKWGKPITQALEASDVFFRTLIEAGEMNALLERNMLTGKPLDENMMELARREARRRADYYVFRSPLDPANEGGQGDVLSAIDNLSSVIYGLRDKVPGAKWFVRFIRTPMNILKQGIEYSPAGVATLKGAKDKQEQMGKAILGSTVFASGMYLAMSGRTTWGVPRNKQEKEMFYQSGRVPYSVKVGDTWVSFSKIGPLAYPLAMSAALYYYEKESPKALSDNDLEKAGDALSATMQFFGDQSYVQNVGDMMKALQGEKSNVTQLLTSVPSQLIPLSSLQRWVNSIIDPFYRKSEPGISVESIVDNLQKSIIGASQFVPPSKDIYGKPSKKTDPLINAVSPLQVSPSNKTGDAMLKNVQKSSQIKNKVKRQAEDMIKKIGK